MRLGILQIGDIHLRSKKNSIFQKYQLISKAVKSDLYEVDRLILLFFGDIAYSGKEREYEHAINLIDGIRKSLEEETHLKSEVILLPGNHDCNFEKDNSVRKSLISNIKFQNESFID